MNPEKYRLQKVLEIRKTKYDEAIQHLALCREKLVTAEIELLKRQNLAKECQEKQKSEQNSFLKKLENGLKASEILTYQNYLQSLQKQELQLQIAVKQQQIAVGQAKIEVEKALNELKEATKELKIIEKHQENWLAEKNQLMEMEEQNVSDEVSLLLHKPN